MKAIETKGLGFEDALKVLAECQSRYNELGKVVSTKDPDSLRSWCDEEARLRYEMQGVKSWEINLGGCIVGTYTVARTKEKPEQTVKRMRVNGSDAIRWLMEDAPENYFEQLAEFAQKLAEDYMLLEGEIIPGAKMVEETIPAEPSRYKNTVLKVDAKNMAKALEAGNSIALEAEHE
ncbi:MAG: hypothetical protein IKF78_16200 [Atopobiaceae bacterium]|nr:hypothetical protein [Atopobiaceae bacterium]